MPAMLVLATVAPATPTTVLAVAARVTRSALVPALAVIVALSPKLKSDEAAVLPSPRSLMPTTLVAVVPAVAAPPVVLAVEATSASTLAVRVPEPPTLTPTSCRP